MSAALTYYTMLSLAPLLMIAIALAGYLFDEGLARSEIIEQVGRFTTESIAQTVASIITNATREKQLNPSTGLIAGSISLFVLFFGASGVFTQLYDTFNDIWKVPSSKRAGIWFTVQERLVGIGMVLFVGIMLLVAILLSTLVDNLGEYFQENYPTLISYLHLAERGVSYLAFPCLLALMFWLIPATKVEFRDVWPAAMLTAILIGLSRYIIEAYVTMSITNEVYGPAGSLVVLLIWVYMTGMVLFYGASFSHAWAQTFGSRSAGFGKDTQDNPE